jgi:curli biogenesis system outer membrane secretion channel CsgG
MKKVFALGLCVALAVIVLAPAAQAADKADKPRIAVLEFQNKADTQYWWRGGGEAMQDVMVTQLVKSGKFRVIEREQLAALMREKNLSLSGDVDPATAVRAGKLLGVKYFLTGAVTEYGKMDSGVHGRGVKGLPGFGAKKSTFVAAANARIIDTETGEIVWADEARSEDSNMKLSIGGFGGGVDNDQRMFDKVMKPICEELTASIKAADI